VICIKLVCDLFDSEQGKKARAQTTGISGFVKDGGKNSLNFSTKTVRYCRALVRQPGEGS